MAERNAVKPRVCEKCGETLQMTASQIKAHAATKCGVKK